MGKSNVNVKSCGFSIYNRQYNSLCKLVENKIFNSKSEIVRQALDFFFCFPYFKQVASKTFEPEQISELEKFYNSKVIKVLEGNEL